ncbi:hypothetical protein EVG20_g5486 [Dentipellis fragilis]|uniref:Uncharacterized protein n=1 Tax=Dentipellis fragilis TaxID=205917 RepID=A0A4Y9YTW3_9AGAM|nr:hypothetical protein EVG20_g5486 [Dentipellis fragilis]
MNPKADDAKVDLPKAGADISKIVKAGRRAHQTCGLSMRGPQSMGREVGASSCARAHATCPTRTLRVLLPTRLARPTSGDRSVADGAETHHPRHVHLCSRSRISTTEDGMQMLDTLRLRQPLKRHPSTTGSSAAKRTTMARLRFLDARSRALLATPAPHRMRTSHAPPAASPTC